MSPIHNVGSQVNLVMLTNHHSVKWELSGRAVRLMDNVRLSLEVTSGRMHEISAFD